ncbi:peptidoglycan-binding protein [bacterium c-19]|nr:peptidoglycan-binding protein [bacterium c-19]
MEFIATGYLQVQTSLGDQASAIKQAMVRVYKVNDDEVVFEDFFMTDDTGKTEMIALFAPERSLSLSESNANRPYETYNVQVRANGFEMEEILGVQVFAGEYSYLNVEPIPTRLQRSAQRNIDVIPDHHLMTNEGGNNVGQTPPNTTARILTQVAIPTNITVHLGRPDRDAENVTVPFLYYLKNVASSEIYPTWPYEALKANIWAQMSLVLNRIYTEWYRSKGYSFDITNSTAFDQAFVKNRNIYDSIAEVVDEVFGDYIQKRNYMEPYYAEYCDGKNAQCPGLKQWGTLDLANQGYSALRILRYYYGDEINIRSTDNIQDIVSSYPGAPLRVGSSGQQVRQLQEQLNAIAINYPNIPPIFPVDGNFQASTEAAVRAFQRQFDLGVDGVVGKATWYRISYIYAAVRKLAELKSIGQIQNLYSGEWPGVTLREGSKGVDVQLLQYYLASIGVFYKEIGEVTIDGRFGQGLEQAVIAFQKRFGLIQDGIVGRATWDRIYAVFTSIDQAIVPDGSAPSYPGNPIMRGASGTNVTAIQSALNTVSSQYSEIPVIVVDGIFGSATRNAVIAFQRKFNLPADGIVNQETWDLLFTTANEIDNGDLPSTSTPPFPGTVLRVGSRGNDVLLIQQRLKAISIYYTSIPDLAADGIFGNGTRASVTAFQQLMGIPADGVVGQQTWHLINQTYQELMQ